MLVEVKPDFEYLLEVDYLFLSVLSKMAPDGDAVEIGSGTGSSTLAIARTGRFVHSVDIIFNDMNGEKAKLWKKNTRPVSPLTRAYRGPSKEVGEVWDSPIAFLFIDGNHKYEFVSEDIKIWTPKVIKNGIIAFHDYGYECNIRFERPQPMKHPGVKIAVDQWIERNKGKIFDMRLFGMVKAFRLKERVVG